MAESSFPQSLDYSPNPLSISARSYESKCIPESSSTSYPSEIVRIRIPSGRAGSYLNQNKSFLSFTVVNTSTATAVETPVETSKGYEDSMARNYAKLYIDGSAYSVIQTQEVYNSSNLLESIQNANVLYNMLVDMQTGMSSRWTGSSILGIGATGLPSQAWAQYRGATLFDGFGTAQDYGFNVISGRDFTSVGGPFTGLNIINSLTGIEQPPTEPPVEVFTDGVVVVPVIAAANVPGGGTKPRTETQQPSYAFVGPLALPTLQYWATDVENDGNGPVQRKQAGIYDRGASHMNGWISRLGPVIPYGMRAKFTLPLVSGVVGTLCCKLFPLHALNSDLMLHLTLASANTVACNNYIPSHWNVNVPDGHVAGLLGQPSGGSSSIYQVPVNDPGTPSPDGSWKIDVNYRLEEIAFHACMVEVSAQAQAMLDQATGGQYVIPSSSYRQFSHSLQSSQTNNEFPVPARFTSVKSLLGCQRPTDSLNRPDRFSLSSRVKNNMTRLQYRVGSLLVPQEPIRMENIDKDACAVNSGKAPEAFCHLLEAVGRSACDSDLDCGMNDHIFGANHDIDYSYTAGGLAGGQNWVLSAAASQEPTKFDDAGVATQLGQSDKRFYKRLAAGSRAGFCFGVDLESFNNAGCTGPMQSGTNTLGLNIMCRLWCDSLTTQTGSTILPAEDIIATTVDHFVLHDTVLVVSGGVCSVRF
jgi:hypothetical protein